MVICKPETIFWKKIFKFPRFSCEIENMWSCQSVRGTSCRLCNASLISRNFDGLFTFYIEVCTTMLKLQQNSARFSRPLRQVESRQSFEQNQNKRLTNVRQCVSSSSKTQVKFSPLGTNILFFFFNATTGILAGLYLHDNITAGEWLTMIGKFAQRSIWICQDISYWNASIVWLKKDFSFSTLTLVICFTT